MPEGSLTLSINDLRTALDGVTGLLGEEPAGGAPGSNLAGAAGLASDSLGDRFNGVQGTLTGLLSGVFDIDSSTALTRITDVFGTLRSNALASPTEALTGFEEAINQVSGVFSGDYIGQLQTALVAIKGIANGVPQDRTAIVSALLDQILSVIGSLEGPEAEKIRSWVQSLQAMHRDLMPLIALAQAAPDPTTLVLEVVQRTVNSTLDTFGFQQIRSVLDFVDGFPGQLLPADLLTRLLGALGTTSTAYSATLPLVSGGYPQFRNGAVAAGEAMQQLKREFRPTLIAINRITRAPIFRPNYLENFLREQMDAALAVRVQEVQKIDDPFNELFDRIDQAIEGIDLSFVRTEVLGFFETTRETIEQVNIPSVADVLEQQLAPVEQAVNDIQQKVTDLLAEIQQFFDDLVNRLRALAENIGEYQPDGTFQYRFEAQLREVFATARFAIGGDPDNPGAPSLAGSLQQFQSSIDQFLSQLSDLLGPVEDTIQEVKDAAVQGIEGFTTFLNTLDVEALMNDLRGKVAEVVDALVPVDFDAVVDPVVSELEESSQKLRDIDTDSLNDLLREALKVALDVVISVDFTAEISSPLDEAFTEIKRVPQEAIEQLQESYQRALVLLDKLTPTQLLQALFAAFDVINDAVASLDLSDLLQPLDVLHQQYLQDPLAQLKPSTLLQPAADAFQDAVSVFDDISGTAIIAPLNDQLNSMKSMVADIDAAGWIDDLLAAIEQVKSDIRDIRPSEILQPLVDDFAALESELDRFKPSVIFAPAAELAAPLLQFLEAVQQELIDSLFEVFRYPLEALDRLQPEALAQEVQGHMDTVINSVKTVNVPAVYRQLKAQHYDLMQAVRSTGDQRLVSVAKLIDPEEQLGEMITSYNNSITALQGLRNNLALPDLDALYDELRERLLGLLPPYARQLLDPDTFKRVMRLADPTRFLGELDQRFDALKDKLVPIRPQDITAELDATYDAVLDLVDQIDVEDALNHVKDLLNNIKGIVDTIRIDFLAADIDAAVASVRAVVAGLDPSRFFDDLDAIHAEIEQVVANTRPSQLLAGLGTVLDQVKGIAASINPRTVLGPPLEEAWVAVQGVLDEVDFTIILSPVVDKLDELQAEFEASLGRVETAFDQMLGAARSALSGSGNSAAAGVSI